MNELANTVASAFKKNFAGTPSIYFSPGRINLIGEHIDYNDGFVMPAAINKGIYYAVAPNNSDTIHLYSSDFNESYSTTITAVEKNQGWKNYLLSVVNEFVLLQKNIGGFDCAFGGDIPRGSGMSSSAAVEGGLAFALNDIFECGLSRTELARLCQRAEHNFPNVKCGIMDQFANMNGKKDEVILLDCRSLECQYFPIKLNGYKIVLVNSKVHHSLAAGEYNIRRRQCEEGLQYMREKEGIQSFRDIGKWGDLLSYKGQLGETVYNRCLYVVQEIARTQEAALRLQENDLVRFGKLMNASHEGLSKLYEVSCKELDFLATYAQQHEQVIGSRMMGGGFGGCTINIVKDEAIESFIDGITAAYQSVFHVSPEAYVVETSDGTSPQPSP